ncbi:MarR family transcriptional regulator [Tateyamaria sp. ANG-S1]|uniref:MarR family winged helix-turn-helix transcriptional regulator n=1 Tax=Tateyamaria sp. ANG-S1 TaxID=1577905 RepID=UPI00057FA1B7|nr:MarR family transcriptional regulator [Tateyamaria sp. ANG-S1]KIC49230.1 MarR family transcriptional regulator [Tateyamaria sp. ANG-S1]
MTEQTPLARRRLRTWLRLLRLTRATEKRLREYMRVEHNTTLPRFDVMAALYRSDEPLNIGDLSKLLLVSNGNSSTIVNMLERDGLVTREPTEHDRRVVNVALTEKGRAEFEEQARGHEIVINEIFETLDHPQLDVIRDLLRQAEARD